MITQLFKKQPTVEEIHAEFDSAEERILQECDNILSQLGIPTESKVERKAKMMKELGFINSETVKQAEKLKVKLKEIEKKIEITSLQAETIREFRVKYPNQKFITVSELERICEKYNLIHAPAVNYIKDIPEKNVLEMHKSKKLEEVDAFKEQEILILEKNLFSKETPREIVAACTKGVPIGDVKHNGFNTNHVINSILKLGEDKKYYQYNCYDYKIEKINKSGFFIAAPKSHFDLSGVDKKSKYGFFKVEVKEVKDPVVFEYCKNDICRIVTKWGTDDDQSYLDPILLNETLN